MNLDFSNQPLFSWYTVFLLVSGVAMVGLGLIGSGAGKGWRAVNVIFGVGFVGYGIYLAFFFQGTEYYIFFKVFILPVVLIFRSFAAMGARRRQQAAQPVIQAQQAAYQQGAYQAAAAYQQQAQQQGQPQGNPYLQGVPAQPNPYQQQAAYGYPQQGQPQPNAYPQAPAPAPYDPNR